MDDLIYRLRKRAEIRRQIPTRKSVQNNEPDRIADLLEEAAVALEQREASEFFDKARTIAKGLDVSIQDEALDNLMEWQQEFDCEIKTKPLSDEEIINLYAQVNGGGILAFARAIEERHGIK